MSYKPKQGRPTKYNKATAEAVLTALRGGNTRRAAAGVVGINYTTLLEWIKKYPDFCDAVEAAESEIIAVCEDTMARAAKSGNTDAAKYLLRYRHPEIYTETTKSEVTLDIKNIADALDAED